MISLNHVSDVRSVCLSVCVSVCLFVCLCEYVNVCVCLCTQRYPCVDINVILGKAVELAGLR